jgi:hypothetical protein
VPCITAGHWRCYGRPFIIKGLGCCNQPPPFCIVKQYHKLLTGLVNGYGTSDMKLLTTLPTVPFSCPVTSNYFNHPAAKQFVADTNVKEAVTWPQTTDIYFFYAGKKALVLQWEKHLNVTTD